MYFYTHPNEKQLPPEWGFLVFIMCFLLVIYEFRFKLKRKEKKGLHCPNCPCTPLKEDII